LIGIPANSSKRLHDFRAVERLRNGAEIEIRALRPADREPLLAAVRGMSDQSVYRRFFVLKREFSEGEIARFVEVDFDKHVALVAVEQGGGRAIVGGARYVTVEPGRAELACAVVDRVQGQGLGKLLLHHLYALAAQAGIEELIAEVLPDNLGMLKLFQATAPGLKTRREGGVVHVSIRLAGSSG
jgi:ribosomal protein S18 acetylase RimI-like enzyme